MIAAMSALRTWFDGRWLAVAMAALVVLLALTHIPQEMMPKALDAHLLDKVEHVVAYGVVAFLFLLSFRRPLGVTGVVVFLLVAALVGGLDEMTQPWVNRTASGLDFVADMIGVVVAYVIFLAMRLCRRERVLHSVTPS